MDQILNVAEFEALARAETSARAFWLSARRERTTTALCRLNHDAYSHIEIRSRRFVDVSKLDTTRNIFGSHWKQPFYFSAVSSMRAFHPEARSPWRGLQRAGKYR